MKVASIFATALLGIPPVIADEPTVESLTRRIEVLEQKVATLSAPVSAPSVKVQTASAPESVTQAEIIVNVLEDGRLRVEGHMMADAEVSKRFKDISAQFPDQPVRIRGHMDTKYQNIVRVIDLCQQSGLWNISFATAKTRDEQAGRGDGDKPSN